MARNKLVEIASVRARGQSGAMRGRYAVDALHHQWIDRQDAQAPPAAFIVIRLVTALEVFTRDWLKEIIDAGEPYIGRAADLVKGSLKIDFAVAQALVGKQVTFGDLVAHGIPVNGVGDIDRVFTMLLDRPLFKHLETVVDRYSVEICGELPQPILADPSWTRAQLGQLFELRHIHVHELPDEPEIDPATVSDFVSAASSFCKATDEMFATLLHGNYPMTQLEMNARAGEKAFEAKQALSAELKRLDPDRCDAALQASQEAWEVYRERQAEFRSGINRLTRGSIAPLLYADEVEKITLARIEQLEWYFNRKEGDF